MRLEVTRRAGLAVRALAALSPPGTRLKAGELATALDTTAGFMPQVVGPLVKAGWVRSVPGPTGGYVLSESAITLSVLDVVEAIDGPTDTGRCVVEGHPCGSAGAPCVLHRAWASSRAILRDELAATPALPPT
ncbi:transcriptional regulator, BadM/Rrf2 family [Austwickia chelonae]|uniref:Putative Rrf2 family DNA-binding protein n=1 Tax=Austwickia chelonae NBRC 105200 TaxID=1184607 RepID=K6V6V2_9MICO|nr:Rrf2 family transcriptional regulator [Austwickia chelonae]GAB77958.1 putative Rrf2 family DNA-binding protein [Austwickia chelonae NBRC 105200]SEV93080.1 transcriptional regulator, BadM/Rrf2 family [Austwickia chelonae]